MQKGLAGAAVLPVCRVSLMAVALAAAELGGGPDQSLHRHGAANSGRRKHRSFQMRGRGYLPAAVSLTPR